jgi:DNA gyrase subunit B
LRVQVLLTLCLIVLVAVVDGFVSPQSTVAGRWSPTLLLHQNSPHLQNNFKSHGSMVVHSKQSWKSFGTSLLSTVTANANANVITTQSPQEQVTSSKANANAYDAAAITVLQGLEAVRRRPGMYIGSTGPRGLTHLVFEVVDNAVDEALAGHCTEIRVVLRPNHTISVQDNGRGIPCEVHPVTQKSSLETVLCVLHAGGKFGEKDSGYTVSGGLHGVGISVVNALSEHMSVEVVRKQVHHSMRFERGVPTTDLLTRPADPAEFQGTLVTFQPDGLIFKETLEVERDKIAERLDEFAYLNPGLRILLSDERNLDTVSQPKGSDNDLGLTTGDTGSSKNNINDAQSWTREFLHAGGITELVTTQCSEKPSLHPEKETITINQQDHEQGIQVEVALRWSKDSYSESLCSFANGIRTVDGGTHVEGMKQAITKSLNAFARKVCCWSVFAS